MRFHAELRAASVDGNKLAGHAAVFGQLARIRGGWEAIGPKAFDATLGRGDDVVALRDHDPGQLLGRTASGTLRLAVDDEGLAFEVDLPDTVYARDVRELVGRGDLTGASFGFLPGVEEFGTGPDGTRLRTHTSVDRLLDVSVVAMPAYDGTSVTLRSYEPPILSNRTRLILARHRARNARR